MLGTRRSSVTVAAGMLEKAGLIAHSRGDVEIIDRKKLEEAACECYGLMQRQVKAWQGDAEAQFCTPTHVPVFFTGLIMDKHCYWILHHKVAANIFL